MSLPGRFFALLLAITAALIIATVLSFRGKQVDSDSTAPLPVTHEAQPGAESPTPSHEIPKADLLSALTTVCSGDTLNPSGSDDSEKELTQQEMQAQIDAFHELRSTVSARLSISSAAEHFHVAAILEDDPAVRVELLDRAISLNPSDSFLLWRGLQICSESPASASCPLRDLEQRLLAVDGQNSETWIRIAANRYKAGETEAALEAMKFAATAAETRIYWTETIEMIERGLAAAGSNDPFPERAAMALGFAAMNLPNYGDFTTMCREQSLRSADWAYTCLRYGERAERQGKTVIGVSIARSIQRLALEVLGEPGIAAAVEERDQQELQSINNYDPLVEKLTFSNPALFSEYLATVRSVGETAARDHIAREVERLVKQRPELACAPI